MWGHPDQWQGRDSAERERALRKEVERLREALRGVLQGRVVLDHAEDGSPLLLDLSTDPAEVISL